MADVDAVAAVTATGKAPDNPAPATQHNQTDATGTASPDAWGTGVDESLRKVIEVKGWKAPADAVKSYVDLEKYASKNVQDMTSEEREKFVKRLGRPESPDAYELGNVDLPQGMTRDAEFDKGFKELVFKVQALPLKEQAKHYHEYFLKDSAKKYADMKQNIAKVFDASETELRKAWGLDFDANMALSQKVAKLGGDKVVQWLNSGPGKLAVLREWMYNIGKLMSDSTLERGSPVPRDVVDNSKGLLFDPVKMGLRTADSR